MIPQLLALCLALSGANGDSIPTAAVVAFEPLGASSQEAEILTERFRTELAVRNAYRLVERSRMDEILREQGFQQTGCTSTECAVQTGRLLGVRRTIAGSLSHMGSTWSVTAREIDVETGEILKVAVVDLQANIDEVLTSGMGRLADKLSGRPVKSPGATFLDGLRNALNAASTPPVSDTVESVVAPPAPPPPAPPVPPAPLATPSGKTPDEIPFQIVLAVFPVPPGKSVRGLALDVGWGTLTHLNGIQAGLANQTDSSMQGIQGGVVNIAGDQKGIQGGAVNISKSLRGVQGGVLNATGKSQGVQAGLVNISEDCQGIQFGLLNMWKNNGQSRVFPLVGGIF